MTSSKKHNVDDLENQRKKAMEAFEKTLIGFLKMTGGAQSEVKIKIKKRGKSEFSKAKNSYGPTIKSVYELAVTNVKVVKPRTKLTNRKSQFSKVDQIDLVDEKKQKRDSKGRFVKE